jgi:hypothetical protein
VSQVQLGERGLPVDSRLAFWLNQSASNTSLPGQDDPPGRFFIWAGARYIRSHRPFHPAHMAKRDNRRGAESQAPHRRTSSLIGPCISSFPSLFRLQSWTELLNHSSVGGRQGSGDLVMHGVMRALIARWLALIAMLGLFALVVATSGIPCVPYGLWPALQMNCR